MDTTTFVILFLGAVGALCFGWLLVRNQLVYRFRTRFVSKCYDERKHLENCFEPYDRMPSYDSMMLSFKKLRMESYLTAEQIEKYFGENKQ